jgi:hypothetical protein
MGSETSGSTPNLTKGVNILPIPPPLEFPYPRISAESSAPSAADIRTASEPQQPRPVHRIDGGSCPAGGATALISNTQSRPSIGNQKFMTERPVAKQRGSILAIRRRQTGVPTPYNNAAWDSDSSSSSSSSEDDEEDRTRSGSKNKNWESRRSQVGNKQNGHKRRDSNPYSRFSVGNNDYKSRGRVSKRDGRLNISLNETGNRGYLAKALGATLHKVKPSGVLSPLHEEDASRQALSRVTTQSTMSTTASAYSKDPVPHLNVVIMVIGSRGDIQPFLRLGKLLKEEHGHRVRIATHPAFKKFVEQDSGLEFFSVGGDPAEIMAFMVKNPGLIPKPETIRSGEIGRRRDSMFHMFQGFWRACINTTDDERDPSNRRMMADKHPFVADVIIANPPSIAHIHCAERLGIPLHLIFTFPCSPTQQFPHPLTNIKQSNVDANYTNFISYPLVETM